MAGMVRSSGIAEASVHFTYKLLVLSFVNVSLAKVNSMIEPKYDVGEDYKRACIYGYII